MSHKQITILHLVTDLPAQTIPNNGYAVFNAPKSAKGIGFTTNSLLLRANHTYLAEGFIFPNGANGGLIQWVDFANNPVGLFNQTWTTATGLINHHNHPTAIIQVNTDFSIRLRVVGSSLAIMAHSTIFIREA